MTKTFKIIAIMVWSLLAFIAGVNYGIYLDYADSICAEVEVVIPFPEDEPEPEYQEFNYNYNLQKV